MVVWVSKRNPCCIPVNGGLDFRSACSFDHPLHQHTCTKAGSLLVSSLCHLHAHTNTHIPLPSHRHTHTHLCTYTVHLLHCIKTLQHFSRPQREKKVTASTKLSPHVRDVYNENNMHLHCACFSDKQCDI